MHESALDKAKVFRSAYLEAAERTPLSILDVGSASVDGQAASNRAAMANPLWPILGIDIAPGRNVGLVVADPYDWRELATGTFDVVTCSQVFEHAEFFWITMLEIARVLKINGLAFVTSPAAGPLHRFPVDCWRFYDDSFAALARYSGLRLVESHVQWAPVFPQRPHWRDASAVFQRPALPREAQQAAARRLALGKLMAREQIDAEALAGLDAETDTAHSALPVAVARGAFAKRDEELAGQSSKGRKLAMMVRQVREIGRIARTPLAKLKL